jgi:signal transduction histidine kinase
MARAPRILLLDEPTAALGVRESALVERLITRLRAQGTTIALSSHDVGQMFRLADRIIVLRHGRLVAEVSPSEVHPDDVAALISGQKVDSSARGQLTRLHSLAGRLVTSDPSSSLSLILSALGAAIGSERLAIHLLTPGGEEAGRRAPAEAEETERVRVPELYCAASLGVPANLLESWSRLPADASGGPVGLAATTKQPVAEDNIPARPGSWSVFDGLARSAKVASSWSVPVLGPGGLLGVITVFRSVTGRPRRDDLDLATLYAGYAASAIERDRLLEEVTARNQVLETIREMLQTLAGPALTADGLRTALDALRGGLNATEAALVTAGPDGMSCRAYSRADESAPADTLTIAAAVLGSDADEDSADVSDGGRCRSVTFTAPGGRTVLLACWPDTAAGAAAGSTDLLEDAARSLRMALEREKALADREEAMALRRSRDMQHAFLRRLSHELRTPLTAITGYASSLLQRDVTWDAGTQQRFLSRIAAESSRLGRLVNDLLDFSAIESGIFRLDCDWCDLPLVIDAAVAVLPPEQAPMVEVKAPPGLPAIWADHDRLEQVFVNLLSNALGHNPPGTRVQVTARAAESGIVTVQVTDDGTGLQPELLREPPAAGLSRRRGGGAGLGLSIAQGIVAAHGGTLELEPAPRGTCLRITLPVENGTSGTVENETSSTKGAESA